MQFLFHMQFRTRFLMSDPPRMPAHGPPAHSVSPVSRSAPRWPSHPAKQAATGAVPNRTINPSGRCTAQSSLLALLHALHSQRQLSGTVRPPFD